MREYHNQLELHISSIQYWVSAKLAWAMDWVQDSLTFWSTWTTLLSGIFEKWLYITTITFSSTTLISLSLMLIKVPTEDRKMVHLKMLFWLANLFFLWMWLTVAQSCNPHAQSCQLCTTQSRSGLPKKSKYLIDLYTFQVFSPVIYPLNLPLF